MRSVGSQITGPRKPGVRDILTAVLRQIPWLLASCNRTLTDQSRVANVELRQNWRSIFIWRHGAEAGDFSPQVKR